MECGEPYLNRGSSVSLLIGIGIVLLANTRPFEGLLACLMAAFILGSRLLRCRRNEVRTNLQLVVLPVSAVLLAGGIAMGIYNRAVTGTFTSTPYEVHQRQYWRQGPFIFSARFEPERTPRSRLIAFQHYIDQPASGGNEFISRVTARLIIRLSAALGTPFGILIAQQRPPYEGVFVWLALLVLVWFRSEAGFLITAVLAAAGECVLWWYGPGYLAVLTVEMTLVWILAFAVTSRHNQWARFIIFGVGVLALEQSIVLWWSPHYAAPMLPVCLPRSRRRSNGSRAVPLVLGSLQSWAPPRSSSSSSTL